MAKGSISKLEGFKGGVQKDCFELSKFMGKIPPEIIQQIAVQNESAIMDKGFTLLPIKEVELAGRRLIQVAEDSMLVINSLRATTPAVPAIQTTMRIENDSKKILPYYT